jgi:acyl-CoA synthetase (NDP forming)
LLLGANIPTARLEHVDNVYDAVSAAMRMGFPVALKGDGPSLLHKTESGAVKLGLADEREVREAYDDLQSRLGDAMTGAIVQQMISGGVEVMVGSLEDPTFGQVIAFGAGGTLVELLSDVTLRMHPLTDADADDMLLATKATTLLRGFRGAKPSDVAAVKDVLLRVSAMLTVCPESAELDINPLKALEQGAYAVDARVRVKHSSPRPPTRRVSY